MQPSDSSLKSQFRGYLASPAAAYVLPFVLYLLGTNIITRFGDASYPLAYTGVVAIVGACILHWQWTQQIIRPHLQIGLGVLFGILGIVLWIVISDLRLEQLAAPWLPGFLQPPERVGFDPFEQLSTTTTAWMFIAVRLLGIAVIVPIAEELFWRGFLLRWLIDPDWQKVPVGEFTWQSCAIVTLMFTLAHPEWLAAATYCLLINGLLYWKRDLWLCIVAHAVSNLLLAIYVLATGNWWLW